MKMKTKRPGRHKGSKRAILPRWSSKSVRNGSFSVVITAVVIAIVAAVNLIAGELPSSAAKVDVSENKLYTVGEQTKEVVKGLTEDVTLYLVAESGSEDDNLQKLLERYEELSSHLKVETKDPVLYPKFSSQFTDEEVASNSIIVAGQKRNKVISYSEMYETSMDYNTYSYSTTGFDGEGQITSAIAYVTTEELPVMYVLAGHEESPLTSDMTAAVEKGNIEIRDLSLLTSESVPEDADCLFLFAPQKDLSQEEADKIITYLENGGRAFIVSGYTGKDMPNFQSVLQNYGVRTMDGIVLEGDANHYVSGNPSYLVPDVAVSDATGDLGSKNSLILMPVAQGIETLDTPRETIDIQNILTTSESAYVKKDAENMTTLEKEDGDESGTFTLGVAITENRDDVETKMVYLSSSSLFVDSINQAVSGTNMELMSSVLSWMCGQESSVSIPSKSMQVSYLTLTSASAGFWSMVSTALLPALCLLTGGVIWFRRRKK
ncbi:MAG: GldG family protein [Lachnospiraceae bacterium]|jgi:ABC-2 type transport system permease protein|nr:GldG family protein [Lachnospiraceae bacterium]